MRHPAEKAADLARRRVVLRWLMTLTVAILISAQILLSITGGSGSVTISAIAVSIVMVAILLNEKGHVDAAYAISVIAAGAALVAVPVLHHSAGIASFYTAVLAAASVLASPRRLAPFGWIPAVVCWGIILSSSSRAQSPALGWTTLFLGGLLVTGAIIAVFTVGWYDRASTVGRLKGAEHTETALIQDLTAANARLEQLVAERTEALAAVSVATDQLIDDLKESSVRDHLTGLHNRRQIADEGDRMFSHASRTDAPLMVALLDLDHFKEINDTFGHQTGDVVLSRVGAVMAAVCRGGDLVCRLGGDEFAIVMPDADSVGAAELISRLNAGLAHSCLDLIDRPVSATNGLVAKQRSDRSLRDTLDRADSVLMAAKAQRGISR